MGFEPATSSLPRKCSTPELQQQLKSGRRDSNPRPSAWKANALSTELLPQFQFAFLSQLIEHFVSVFWQLSYFRNFKVWAVKDSNLRSRKTAELQSAPVGHFGNCPVTLLESILPGPASSVEPLVGFEPTTPRLQITCSGQLS